MRLDRACPDQARRPIIAAQVAPIFTKYCAGCHNDEDREGKFSLETFASLQKGTEKGPAILPGDAKGSLMIRVLDRRRRSRSMPPKGEPRPEAGEIALIEAWIEAGARGPQGEEPDRLALIVPKIPSHTKVRPDRRDRRIARRQAGWPSLAPPRSASTRCRARARPCPIVPSDCSGKFPGQGHRRAFHARWQPAGHGLGRRRPGRASRRSGTSPTVRSSAQFAGHRDILYDAELSPDGKRLATCGYDKQIEIWDAATGKLLRTLEGHTGAIYDVAFSPDSRFLVSASADDTCKVWRVEDGQRMDTLPQPLKAEYTCTFSPDGQTIVAAGADNNIRVWQFVSRDKPEINPMVIARFAHEGPIVRLAFTPDGAKLVSLAEDRTVKVWRTSDYSELRLWENQPDVATALAFAGDGCVRGRAAGRVAGELCDPRGRAGRGRAGPGASCDRHRS